MVIQNLINLANCDLYVQKISMSTVAIAEIVYYSYTAVSTIV